MTTAYPLAWPDGWPRHKGARESDGRVAGKAYGLTMGRARNQLQRELASLGATDVVLSSNVHLRQDGLPYSEQRRLTDPGVAIYFRLNGKQLVMANDRFVSVAGNLRSLALAIDGMRQLERHGGGTMMERAFQGFAAITGPDWKKPWREVFGLKPGEPVGPATLKAMYRAKATERHPDRGGHDTLMAELNVAFEEAQAEVGGDA